MIVTEQDRDRICLRLIGPLDDVSAHGLVHEYYEAWSPGVRTCVLDLNEAQGADRDGLNALHRLVLVGGAHGTSVEVRCARSAARRRIAAAAQLYGAGVDSPPGTFDAAEYEGLESPAPL